MFPAKLLQFQAVKAAILSQTVSNALNFSGNCFRHRPFCAPHQASRVLLLRSMDRGEV
jgi:hypothetical protein